MRNLTPTVVTIVIVLSIPFIAGGLFVFRLGLRGGDGAPLMLVIGGLFALTGIGTIVGVLVSRTKQVRSRQAYGEHPNDPWMVNPDWRTNRIVSKKRSKSAGNLIAAIAFLIISALVCLAIPIELPKGNHGVWFVLIFPLVSLLFFNSAVRAWLQAVRWGESVLVLETLPIPVGGALRARIETRVPRERLASSDSITASLRAVNSITTNSHGQLTTSNRQVNMDFTKIDGSKIEAGAAGGVIPIEFQIPVGAPPTDNRDPYDEVTWTLVTNAELPGINYEVEFDVPVFRT